MPEETKTSASTTNFIKMAGYLEKKCKMGMMGSRWRRCWCVLDGRLLLYYKSQNEYSNLSPCRGSLNMGLAASVTPARNFQLHVATRSQLFVLKASTRSEQEQWLQALLDSMTSPNNSSSVCVNKPVQHFRYPSRDNETTHPVKEIINKTTNNNTVNNASNNYSKNNVNNNNNNNNYIDEMVDNVEESAIENEKIRTNGYQNSQKRNLMPINCSKFGDASNLYRGVLGLNENLHVNKNETPKSETLDYKFMEWNKNSSESEIYNHSTEDSLVTDVLNFINSSSQTMVLENNKNTINTAIVEKTSSDKVKCSSTSREKLRHSETHLDQWGSSKRGERIENSLGNERKTNHCSDEKRVFIKDWRLKIKSDSNLNEDPIGSSVEKLFTCINKDTRITRKKSNEIKENILKMRSISDVCLFKNIYDDTNILHHENEPEKSLEMTESTLELNTSSSGKSKSCENVYVSLNFEETPVADEKKTTGKEEGLNNLQMESSKLPPCPNPGPATSTPVCPIRSNSFLKRLVLSGFSKDSDKVENIKKRSIGFLRKLVLRRKTKQFHSLNLNGVIARNSKATEQPDSSVEYLTIDYPHSLASSSEEPQMLPDYFKFNTHLLPRSPAPEPVPDYDEYSSDSDYYEPDEPDEPPDLPPRQSERPISPWHDIPKNNQPIDPKIPPPLPQKSKKQNNVTINSNHTNQPNDQPSKNNLDVLLDDLNVFNVQFGAKISDEEKKTEECIYDIPRPHAILSMTLQETSLHESRISLNCYGDNILTEPDSLDISSKHSFWTDSGSYITPDSLEMNWCSKEENNHYIQDLDDVWINNSLSREFFNHGEQFPDSLDFNRQPQNYLLQSET